MCIVHIAVSSSTQSDDSSVIALGCHHVTHGNTFVPAPIEGQTTAVAGVESCGEASALLILERKLTTSYWLCSCSSGMFSGKGLQSVHQHWWHRGAGFLATSLTAPATGCAALVNAVLLVLALARRRICAAEVA